MTRLGRFLSVSVALLTTGLSVFSAAACSLGQPTAGPVQTATSQAGSPSPSVSGSKKPSASPSASQSNVIEFSTDGAGPYVIGGTLASMQANPGVDEMTPDTTCPGDTVARGKDVWKDVHLHFNSDGKLYMAVNQSISIPTPSGAWVGQTSHADLKTIYKSLTTEDLTRGTNTAFLVQTLGGGGILFTFNPDQKVESMMAADSFYLKNKFLGGNPFC